MSSKLVLRSILMAVLCLCFLLMSGSFLYAIESVPPAQVWNFDSDSAGTLPKDFVIGSLFDGRPAGEWKVFRTPRAQSPPHVFGQVMGKGAEHAYKVVLINGTNAADVRLQVSFLPIDGKGDMGGGLVWRATDDRNYYLTRANPLEQNIRIYRIVDGVRHMLQNFDQTIDVKEWHILRVVNQGCRIQILYDDKKVFDFCDQTFTSGRIGLWTKSDAVTYFDDLQLQRLK